MLQEPPQNFLVERKPDCIVHDVFHRWSADAIDSLGNMLRITFNGNGYFARCPQENMGRYKSHEKVGSDMEPFVAPGLPDRIESTRSQLPLFARQYQAGEFGCKNLKKKVIVSMNWNQLMWNVLKMNWATRNGL